MALRNTVKGSNENANIRLISANALFQLVKIFNEKRDDLVLKQINNMLRPRDYFVLDSLVELVFPQTDAEIDAVEDVEDEMDTVNRTGVEVKPDAEVKSDAEIKHRERKAKYIVVDENDLDDADRMHYVGKKVVADGYYLSETDEFVVLKGSEFSKTETDSCNKSIKAMRKSLIDDDNVEEFLFVKSVKFFSPTTAAQMVYGGSQNGRTMWADEDGVTIKEKYG